MVTTACVGIVFLVWTLLVPAVTEPLDGLWRFPVPDRTTALGQIASAISLVSARPVIYALMLIAAWWAKDRRLNSMAGTILLAAVLTWSASVLIQHAVARERPASPWDYLITQQGNSYPSGHVAAVTSAAIVMVTLVTNTRRRPATVLVWRVSGVLAILVVSLNRLILQAHYISDVIGGILLGALTTCLALLICDAYAPAGTRGGKSQGRAAVIYNPTKVPDPTTFMRLVNNAVADGGWDPPIWLATAPDDPGRAMARSAREAGVGLVMIAGGDGTVRVVCGELAGSGIRLAIVPAGTGNLLARNLEIPLDYARALRLLVDGEARPLDVVKFTTDDDPDLLEYSVVMAGVGADAAIMNDTDEQLKRQIGSLAYFAAGVNHIKAAPIEATMSLDGSEPTEIEASLIGIGNVGDLQGGLTVIPEASASDGLMDVMLANPSSPSEIAQMLGAVLTNPDQIPHLQRHTAKTVELRFAAPSLFQIDGDVIGEVGHLRAEVMHHVIELTLPRRQDLSKIV